MVAAIPTCFGVINYLPLSRNYYQAKDHNYCKIEGNLNSKKTSQQIKQ